MKIAFFDSGIGGLAVLREAVRILPDEQYIYYADSKNAPYGSRSKEEVLRLTVDAVKSLDDGNIKALVVACNTATSIAIETLRAMFGFPVIGMEPAVKAAVERTLKGRILALATPLTLREEKFRKLLQRLGSEDRVDMLPLQKLVEFAERGIFSGSEVEEYIDVNFSRFPMCEYGAVVLGCTHFSFFYDLIKKAAGGCDIYDGNEGTARQLSRVIDKNPSESAGFSLEIYISGEKLESGTQYERMLGLACGGALWNCL